MENTIKLTLSHRALCRKLRGLGGKGTALQLNTTYGRVEPLIRYGYVRVLNEDGTAVYQLTGSGDIWAGDD